MDASALDEILNWMDADGYGVPIGTHERKDEAREELAALRARLRNAEQVIADANHVGTTGGVYGWASKAGRSRNARAVFLASTPPSPPTGRTKMDADRITPLTPDEFRRAQNLGVLLVEKAHEWTRDPRCPRLRESFVIRGHADARITELSGNVMFRVELLTPMLNESELAAFDAETLGWEKHDGR